MTYAEKMTMKLMGEMGFNYGNQSETLKTVQQIIVDIKKACIAIVNDAGSDPIDLRSVVALIEVAEAK